MIETLLILTLFLHGLGHALFVANAWGYRRAATAYGPAYSLDTEVEPGATTYLGLLWVAPLFGFVAGAWGIANGAPGWQPLLFAAALASSLLIVLRWRRINVDYALFALAFNVFVIALLYWNSQGLLFAA